MPADEANDFSPDGGLEWGVRFTMTFLFPK
jgi:hypothetical protein